MWNTNLDTGDMPVEAQEELMSSQQVTVHGHITWLDEANAVHDAVNVQVRIIEHRGAITITLATVITDEDGFYSATIPSSSVSQEGIFASVNVGSVGDNIEVTTNSLGMFYEFRMANISNYFGTDLQIDYQIDVNSLPEGSEVFAYAFRVHQAMDFGARYVETLTGDEPEKVTILYPSNGTHYNYVSGKIHILESDTNDWDVLLHEYGHYIADCYNIDASPGGDHDGPCENASKGKEEGMPFAWSEGWATYFSISAQIDMNAASYGIVYVGDIAYTDAYETNDLGVPLAPIHYSVETPPLTSEGKPMYEFGESNECAITVILWDLADNTPLEDGVHLGFTYIWNLIIENECQDLSEFINVLNAHSGHLSRLKIGEILSAHDVSPVLLSPANDANENWEIPTFTWDPKGGKVTADKNYQNNLFSLAFYNNQHALILETPETTNAYYTPTEAEWSQIRNATLSNVYWCVKAKQTSDNYVTGWYYSNYHKLILPTPPYISSNGTTGHIDESDQSHWYRFIAPYRGVFSFETTGTLDSYGELFSQIVYGKSNLHQLENGYDDDSGEDYNFKIEYALEAGQNVYLRVRGANWSALGTYNLTVTCVSHEHEYEYVVYEFDYHIRQCACGATTGVPSPHIPSLNAEGRFKPCIRCGFIIDTGGSSDILTQGVMTAPITDIANTDVPNTPNNASEDEENTVDY